MLKRQNIDGAKPLLILGPVMLSADNVPVALDVEGFRHAEIEIFTGIGGISFTGSNKIEWVLSHGDDTTVANHTPVAAADVLIRNSANVAVALVGSGIVWQLIAAHPAADFRTVHYIGKRRYLSLLADFSGTHGAGTPLAARLRRSWGRNVPAL